MKKYIITAIAVLSIVACKKPPVGGNKNIVKKTDEAVSYRDNLEPSEEEPDFGGKKDTAVVKATHPIESQSKSAADSLEIHTTVSKAPKK